MAASFGMVENKVAEAEFFLMKLADCNIPESRYYFSAYLSAARSVTFALQASMKGVHDFEIWYKDAQSALKQSKVARMLKKLRDENIHIGRNPINCFPFKEPREILTFFSDLKKIPSRFVYKDGSAINIDIICSEHFKLLLEIIYECYLKYIFTIDPKWYFTKENFQKMGKTIEDALEESGLPRGWFSDLPINDDAWRAIRRDKPLCVINNLFSTYLGKEIPDPDQGPL